MCGKTDTPHSPKLVCSTMAAPAFDQSCVYQREAQSRQNVLGPFTAVSSCLSVQMREFLILFGVWRRLNLNQLFYLGCRSESVFVHGVCKDGEKGSPSVPSLNLVSGVLLVLSLKILRGLH